MKFSLLSVALVTLLLGASSASAQTPGKPPQATGNERWCADLRVGNPRCAYTTLEECNKFVLPQQGSCVRNPGFAQANSPAQQQNPARAMVGNEPWCADTRVGQPNCGYATLAQCQQAVRPQQGQCIRNPSVTTGSAPQ